MLPQAVSEQYLAQQRLTVSTLGLVRREWATMGNDLDASWAKVGPRIALITSSAQLGAARNGAAYVPAALAEFGGAADMKAGVNVRAFAGVASDGRPLESLLYGAVVKARTTAADSLPERLKAGGSWLDMAVHTQVADAGRGAASVAIAATPHAGYVRMVNPPCCARCAVLAGKTFLFNQGFQRHPRCDCLHAPISLAGDVSRFTDLLETPSLDQIKGLSKADRKALADGADFNRLVNVQQRSAGMRPKFQRTRGSRLTPDDIYRLAQGRDDALRLLRRNGYVTDSPRTLAATSPKPVAIPSAPVRKASLTEAQSKVLDPSGSTAYSAGTRLKVVPELNKTDAGRALSEAAERWQLDKTQVRAIRMVADKRLAGEAVEGLPASMAGLDRETLLRYTDALLDGVRDYAGSKPETVFRGISARAKMDELVKEYAEGSTVDIGLSSWSSASDIAEGFIQAGSRGDVELMLKLEGPTAALPLQNLTTSRAQGLWEEKEWLTAGRFKVTSLKRTRGRLEVTLRQVVAP